MDPRPVMKHVRLKQSTYISVHTPSRMLNTWWVHVAQTNTHIVNKNLNMATLTHPTLHYESIVHHIEIYSIYNTHNTLTLFGNRLNLDRTFIDTWRVGLIRIFVDVRSISCPSTYEYYLPFVAWPMTSIYSGSRSYAPLRSQCNNKHYGYCKTLLPRV